MSRKLALTVILSLALAAHANDGGELSLRSKALASAVSSSALSTLAASAAKHGDAPFAASRDPLPEMLLADEQQSRGLKGKCDTTAKDFCYDLVEGRIVYRAAREYMPSLAGLSPEGVALRHNRIVFRYSFK